MELLERLPHVGRKIADEITLVRSMKSVSVDHAGGAAYHPFGQTVPRPAGLELLWARLMDWDRCVRTCRRTWSFPIRMAYR